MKFRVVVISSISDCFSRLDFNKFIVIIHLFCSFLERAALAWAQSTNDGFVHQ